MKALKEKRVSLRSLFRRSLVILSLFALVFASCGGSSSSDPGPGPVDPGPGPTDPADPGDEPGPAVALPMVVEVKVTKHPTNLSYEGAKVDLTGLEVMLTIKEADGRTTLKPLTGAAAAAAFVTDPPVAFLGDPSGGAPTNRIGIPADIASAGSSATNFSPRGRYTISYAGADYVNAALQVNVFIPTVMALDRLSLSAGDALTPSLVQPNDFGIVGRFASIYEDQALDVGSMTFKARYVGIAVADAVNTNRDNTAAPAGTFSAAEVAAGAVARGDWVAVGGTAPVVISARTLGGAEGFTITGSSTVFDGTDIPIETVYRFGPTVGDPIYANPVPSSEKAWELPPKKQIIDPSNPAFTAKPVRYLYTNDANISLTPLPLFTAPALVDLAPATVAVTNYYYVDKLVYKSGADKIAKIIADDTTFNGSSWFSQYTGNPLPLTATPAVETAWLNALLAADIQFDVVYYTGPGAADGATQTRTIGMKEYYSAMFKTGKNSFTNLEVPKATLPIPSGNPASDLAKAAGITVLNSVIYDWEYVLQMYYYDENIVYGPPSPLPAGTTPGTGIMPANSSTWPSAAIVPITTAGKIWTYKEMDKRRLANTSVILGGEEQGHPEVIGLVNNQGAGGAKLTNVSFPTLQDWQKGLLPLTRLPAGWVASPQKLDTLKDFYRSLQTYWQVVYVYENPINTAEYEDFPIYNIKVTPAKNWPTTNPPFTGIDNLYPDKVALPTTVFPTTTSAVIQVPRASAYVGNVDFLKGDERELRSLDIYFQEPDSTLSPVKHSPGTIGVNPRAGVRTGNWDSIEFEYWVLP